MATEPVPIAQCPFGFANANGQLVCDLEPHHDGVPPGSYLNSCGGCRVAVQDVYDETTGDVTGQTVLECSGCKDGTGNMRERSTSLVIDECVRVGNNHGRLVCEDDGQNNPQPDNGDATTTTTSPWTTQLPPGPYLDSCSGCLLETPDTTGKRHSILRCSACNTRPDNPEGRRVPAELVLTRPHKCDEVVNRFGQLRCRVVKHQQQQPTTTNNNHKTPQQRVVHTTTTQSYTIGSSNAQEQQQEQATSPEEESNDDHESSSSSLAEEQQPPPPIAETTHHDEL